MNRRILVLAGLSAAILLVAAPSPGAAQVGICSDVTAITSPSEKGAALNIAEFDEDIFATRQLCNFKLGDWPTAGETLDLLSGAIFKPPSGGSFPVSPTTGETFIILDDSVSGACDSASGTASTNCRWSGAAWVAVGDGVAGGGGGEANTASNLGGGLANFDSKSVVDLRFNTFSSSDFALATNLFTIANNAVTNAQAGDMATDTVKLRNATGTGDPEDVKISALTEQTTPVAGDFLLCETAGGDLRKCDVGDLPAAGGALALTGGTMTGDIVMSDVDLILNSPSEDWRVFNNAGTFTIFNQTDVLSRFEIGLSGNTIINPSGSIAGDLTWQSDDNSIAFVCDASAQSGAGRCGMGTSAPEHTFDVQATVPGDATFQVKTLNGEATLYLDAGGANNDAEIIMQDDDTDRFKLYDDTSLDRLVFESEFAVNLFMLSFDHSTGAATFNGNGTATADVTMRGDTVSDLFVMDASADQVGVGTSTMGAGADLTVNDILHIVPLVTAPATCVIGNFYVDASGAYCGCSVVNTWENMLATGTCV